MCYRSKGLFSLRERGKGNLFLDNFSVKSSNGTIAGTTTAITRTNNREYLGNYCHIASSKTGFPLRHEFVSCFRVKIKSLLKECVMVFIRQR